MPEVSAQSKTFEPFRAVNGSVSPFIGHLWFQVAIPGGDLLDLGKGCKTQGIVNLLEGLGACRRKVDWRRRMKRFAVAAAQGQRADGRSRSCVLAVPFPALG